MTGHDQTRNRPYCAQFNGCPALDPDGEGTAMARAEGRSFQNLERPALLF